MLSEKGELVQRYGGNAFSIPAIYIAYFATFGAMVSLINSNIRIFVFIDYLGLAFVII